MAKRVRATRSKSSALRADPHDLGHCRWTQPNMWTLHTQEHKFAVAGWPLFMQIASQGYCDSGRQCMMDRFAALMRREADGPGVPIDIFESECRNLLAPNTVTREQKPDRPVPCRRAGALNRADQCPKILLGDCTWHPAEPIPMHAGDRLGECLGDPASRCSKLQQQPHR